MIFKLSTHIKLGAMYGSDRARLSAGGESKQQDLPPMPPQEAKNSDISGDVNLNKANVNTLNVGAAQDPMTETGMGNVGDTPNGAGYGTGNTMAKTLVYNTGSKVDNDQARDNAGEQSGHESTDLRRSDEKPQYRGLDAPGYAEGGEDIANANRLPGPESRAGTGAAPQEKEPVPGSLRQDKTATREQANLFEHRDVHNAGKAMSQRYGVSGTSPINENRQLPRESIQKTAVRFTPGIQRFLRGLNFMRMGVPRTAAKLGPLAVRQTGAQDMGKYMEWLNKELAKASDLRNPEVYARGRKYNEVVPTPEAQVQLLGMLRGLHRGNLPPMNKISAAMKKAAAGTRLAIALHDLRKNR
jgi:hypothetical protein